MNPDVFFKNFELLADAPNGIQKLRELILQLAVRGKLVPQDPNDELASVLLEKIKAEKKELVKGNNGRNSKKSDTTISDEIFNIPSNWIWTKLDTLGITQTGTTPSKSQPEFFGNYIPFIKPADMSESGVRYDNEMLSELGLNSGRLIPKNSVLMVCIGGSIGKTCLVDRNVSCNQQINTISPFSSVDCKFITFIFKSRYFQDQVMEKASTGTLPIINKSKWEQIFVPLPPLAEQKRIVSKVDELMALCDKFEARRQKKQEIQSKLNSAALDRMFSAENQKDFEQNWQRICDNFDILYDNPENVEKLKQAILQLAVQGKLVPQNSEDEQASVLLDRIRKERNIGKGNKTNRLEKFSAVDSDQMIFDIHSNWSWYKFSEVATIQSNLVSPDKYPDLPHIAPNNIEKRTGKLLEYTTVAKDGVISPKHYFYPGQLLYSKIRPNLSKVVIASFEGLCSADMYPIKSYIDTNYLHLYILSETFLAQVTGNDNRVAMPKVNQQQLSNVLVPLPPLEEQKRIVEKVEQLMGLCDELEAKLRKEREDSDKLMEAVVKGLLEGAATEKSELDKPIPLQAAVIQLK